VFEKKFAVGGEGFRSEGVGLQRSKRRVGRMRPAVEPASGKGRKSHLHEWRKKGTGKEKERAGRLDAPNKNLSRKNTTNNGRERFSDRCAPQGKKGRPKGEKKT